MQDDYERYYNTIVDSIKFLALPASGQKELLPSYVDVPFEVLDSFENAFLLLPQLVERSFFSNTALASILRLHTMVRMAGSHLEEIDPDGMNRTDHPILDEIREAARRILVLLNEPIVAPGPGRV